MNSNVAGWVERSPILHHPAALPLLANVRATTTIAGAIVPIKVTGTVLTTTEAAARMRLSKHTVVAYIERGLIKAKKLGPLWLITAAECDRYLRERRPRGNPNLIKTA